MERLRNFARVLQGRPGAVAELRGSEHYPEIRGTVRFYQTQWGVLAAAEVTGLPQGELRCPGDIFAFHIHKGDAYGGNAQDPFADALTHYDPLGCAHPEHAGDLPPLFGNRGKAFQVVLTDRFLLGEILGKTVIVHRGLDDFTTQPSGNAGAKIACGVIRPWGCR